MIPRPLLQIRDAQRCSFGAEQIVPQVQILGQLVAFSKKRSAASNSRIVNFFELLEELASENQGGKYHG